MGTRFKFEGWCLCPKMNTNTAGSCVVKAPVSRVSTDTISSTCWPRIGQCPVEMLTNSWLTVGHHVIQLVTPSLATSGWYWVGMMVNTWPNFDCYTVINISVKHAALYCMVDCWWYVCIVNCCFGGMAAVSYPLSVMQRGHKEEFWGASKEDRAQ